MTEQGYIKLHRSILGWEWWSDANTTRVFLWLLLNAQWEDSRFRGYEVPKGSLVTSYNSISQNLDISVKSARVAIEHLKRTGEVAIKRHSHFSIVTIVNWDKFQGMDDENGNHFGNHEGNLTAIKGQSKGNIKEIKNIRNKEEKKSGIEIYRQMKKNNYDFEALERETREPKRQHYDFEAIDKEIREK